MADAIKVTWVERVLSVKFGAAAKSGGPRPKLMPIWLDAKEEVDASITQLQNRLREEDDEDLNQIVDFGLFGVTEGQTVRLMAALREWDGGAEGAGDKLDEAVKDYQDFLDSGAPVLDLMEDNPFGVSVPLRKTLGSALAELADAVAA